MSERQIEERVVSLERALERLRRDVAQGRKPATEPWWERRFGAFAGDELYEEAARLGAEYRRSQTVENEDVPA